MAHQSDCSDVVARLDKLERQALRLKVAAFAFALIAGSLLLMGQSNPSRTLTVSRLAITDADGHERIVLQAPIGGPEIVLSDMIGKPVVLLKEMGPGADLFLVDRTSGAFAGLTALGGSAGVKLLNTSSGTRSGIEIVSTEKESALSVKNAGGDNRVEIGAGENGPSVELTDHDGYSTTIGNTELVAQRTGEHTQTSAASLVLFGKDNKKLWSAP
jgi:hypothetical protein